MFYMDLRGNCAKELLTDGIAIDLECESVAAELSASIWCDNDLDCLLENNKNKVLVLL